MTKLPHMPLYYKDWMADANLARCSLQAKGTWIELLCLMWDCEERGKLASVGTPWTLTDICQAVRGSASAVEESISELTAKNVLKLDDNGCYYNSRMVKDEVIRKIRAKSGSKGGSKTSSKSEAKGVAKAKQNPANANAIAIGNATKQKKKKKLDFTIPDELKKHEAKIQEWWDYRNAISKPPKAQASITKMYNEMSKLGQNLPASIDGSIANGWTGLFEPKGLSTETSNNDRDLL